jgi:hypothetical protein
MPPTGRSEHSIRKSTDNSDAVASIARKNEVDTIVVRVVASSGELFDIALDDVT